MGASDDRIRSVSRDLWNLIEPIASQVYFSPEAHENYGKLGLPAFGGGYFCSRAACMGQVPGHVVVATFAVFNPAIVLPAVEEGWSKTDAPTILQARHDGAVATLRRLLGDLAEDTSSLQRATEIMRSAAEGVSFAGRPLFAGLSSLPPVDDDPVGAMWRAADVLREHRGDCHIIAWADRVDPVQATLLTELWWNIRLHSYVRTRGWDDDQITAAIARLEDRGLVKEGAFTPEGEELRAAIELDTDLGQREIVDNLGDKAEELFDLLRPWAKAVLAGGGYPRDPADTTRP